MLVIPFHSGAWALWCCTAILSAMSVACHKEEKRPAPQLSLKTLPHTEVVASDRVRMVSRQERLVCLRGAWQRALTPGPVDWSDLLSGDPVASDLLLPVLLLSDAGTEVAMDGSGVGSDRLYFHESPEGEAQLLWKSPEGTTVAPLPEIPTKFSGVHASHLPGAYPPGTITPPEWRALVALMSILMQTPQEVRVEDCVLYSYWRMRVPPITASRIQSKFGPLVFSVSVSAEILCAFRKDGAQRWLLITDRNLFEATGQRTPPEYRGMKSIVELGPETPQMLLDNFFIAKPGYWTPMPNPFWSADASADCQGNEGREVRSVQ